jgi:hypothetical protein
LESIPGPHARLKIPWHERAVEAVRLSIEVVRVPVLVEVVKALLKVVRVKYSHTGNTVVGMRVPREDKGVCKIHELLLVEDIIIIKIFGHFVIIIVFAKIRT